MRFFHALATFVHEISSARAALAGPRDWVRFSAGLLWLRTRGAFRFPASRKTVRLRLASGSIVKLRLDRGDFQSFREVWAERCYRLPPGKKPRVLVDLGANIGLTSIWFASEFGCEIIACVEPEAGNVRLLRENCRLNGLAALVLEAAVGPTDGTALFLAQEDSNRGFVAETGRAIRTVSMASVIRAMGSPDRIDVLKVDIEGSETRLFTEGDLSWLDRIQLVIIEIHPPGVDRDALACAIEEHGFRFLRAGSVFPNSMDMFVRMAGKQGA